MRCPLTDYDPVPAESVVLRTGEERETRKDEILTVTAEVLPVNASNKRVIYSSSDPSVATVDAYGKVTGINEGTAVITATSVDGGYTDSVEITITSDHYHDTWLRNVLEKAPTCEEPGCKMYFLCETCGAWFPDYWGSAEIKDHDSWMIPPLGHGESGWISDDAGHWKQCSRNGCGKILQVKTAHNDVNSDGLCDTCGFLLPKPTQPTTVATEPSVPATVPTQPTQTTIVPTVPSSSAEATTAPSLPTTVTTHTASTQTTETAPVTPPQTPEQNNGWILYSVLTVAALIPVSVLLLRRKKSK